jgi:REP element-mobilizing transposase RayT
MTFHRRILPHLQRDDKRHFVTFCTFRRWTLPESARSIALPCCLHDNDTKHFLHAVVVMPDHVHLIFTPLVNSARCDIYSLAEIMGAIKGASAQFINRQLGRSGKVWQTESFDRVLRSSESLDAKVAYILDNPVRAGLVSRSVDYIWTWRRMEKHPLPWHSRLAPLGRDSRGGCRYVSRLHQIIQL